MSAARTCFGCGTELTVSGTRRHFTGTLTEARKELRRLIRSGDTGEHVAPNKITVTAWIDQWIKAGAPGRRKKQVSQRTLERYAQRTHPTKTPAVALTA